MFYPNERDPLVALRLAGCLVMSLMLFSLCLMPLIFVDLAHSALENLHLSPAGAVFVLVGMILGSVVNVPITRRPTRHEILMPIHDSIGGFPGFPSYQRLRQELVIAINLGGCIIPVLLAVRMLNYIVGAGPTAITITALGIVVNVAVCYRLARFVPGLGIALPVFLPALIALGAVWIGLRGVEFDTCRAPAAFVIGISGPLVGADLLHWRDFERIGAGMVSIGGAGTWDGIVLSGLLAALLS